MVDGVPGAVHPPRRDGQQAVSVEMTVKHWNVAKAGMALIQIEWVEVKTLPIFWVLRH